MTVEIYSDIACPWCYIGERRFFRALAAFPHADDVDVVFRPYQLAPGEPTTPRPLAEVLHAKFGAQRDAVLNQTTEAARADGLDFHFDRALAVNTFSAHRLLHLARETGGAGAQHALAKRLFAAYFSEGRNVADPAVLADLAEAAGLERARVEAFLASDEGAEAVRDEIDRAQRIGVRAVPTFVFDGRDAVQGAQPASTFLQVLETMHRPAGPAGANAPAGDDASCADGTCAV